MVTNMAEGLTMDHAAVMNRRRANAHRVLFQGQEAAVVLVSMAASSGENIPRGIEFLFSRNRLNVAISRARCLAVVVASPRLLEISCRTIEQMVLVNTVCAVRSARALSS
jgi:hypothetical protein